MYGWQQWNPSYGAMQGGSSMNSYGIGSGQNMGRMLGNAGGGWQNPIYPNVMMGQNHMQQQQGFGTPQLNNWQQQRSSGYVQPQNFQGGSGGMVRGQTPLIQQQQQPKPEMMTAKTGPLAVEDTPLPPLPPEPNSKEEGSQTKNVVETKELSAKDAKEQERLNQLKQQAQQWQAQQQVQQQQWQQYQQEQQQYQQVAYQQIGYQQPVYMQPQMQVPSQPVSFDGKPKQLTGGSTQMPSLQAFTPSANLSLLSKTQPTSQLQVRTPQLQSKLDPKLAISQQGNQSTPPAAQSSCVPEGTTPWPKSEQVAMLESEPSSKADKMPKPLMQTPVISQPETKNPQDEVVKVGAVVSPQVTAALEEFERQLNSWNLQFETWREQNRDHPDRAAYDRYEKQWQAWRDQLVQRHAQMKLLADKQRGVAMPGDGPSSNTPDKPAAAIADPEPPKDTFGGRAPLLDRPLSGGARIPPKGAQGFQGNLDFPPRSNDSPMMDRQIRGRSFDDGFGYKDEGQYFDNFRGQPRRPPFAEKEMFTNDEVRFPESQFDRPMNQHSQFYEDEPDFQRNFGGRRGRGSSRGANFEEIGGSFSFRGRNIGGRGLSMNGPSQFDSRNSAMINRSQYFDDPMERMMGRGNSEYDQFREDPMRRSGPIYGELHGPPMRRNLDFGNTSSDFIDEPWDRPFESEETFTEQDSAFGHRSDHVWDPSMDMDTNFEVRGEENMGQDVDMFQSSISKPLAQEGTGPNQPIGRMSEPGKIPSLLPMEEIQSLRQGTAEQIAKAPETKSIGESQVKKIEPVIQHMQKTANEYQTPPVLTAMKGEKGAPGINPEKQPLAGNAKNFVLDSSVNATVAYGGKQAKDIPPTTSEQNDSSKATSKTSQQKSTCDSLTANSQTPKEVSEMEKAQGQSANDGPPVAQIDKPAPVSLYDDEDFTADIDISNTAINNWQINPVCDLKKVENDKLTLDGTTRPVPDLKASAAPQKTLGKTPTPLPEKMQAQSKVNPPHQQQHMASTNISDGLINAQKMQHVPQPVTAEVVASAKQPTKSHSDTKKEKPLDNFSSKNVFQYDDYYVFMDDSDKMDNDTDERVQEETPYFDYCGRGRGAAMARGKGRALPLETRGSGRGAQPISRGSGRTLLATPIDKDEFQIQGGKPGPERGGARGGRGGPSLSISQGRGRGQDMGSDVKSGFGIPSISLRERFQEMGNVEQYCNFGDPLQRRETDASERSSKKVKGEPPQKQAPKQHPLAGTTSKQAKAEVGDQNLSPLAIAGTITRALTLDEQNILIRAAEEMKAIQDKKEKVEPSNSAGNTYNFVPKNVSTGVQNPAAKRIRIKESRWDYDDTVTPTQQDWSEDVHMGEVGFGSQKASVDLYQKQSDNVPLEDRGWDSYGMSKGSTWQTDPYQERQASYGQNPIYHEQRFHQSDSSYYDDGTMQRDKWVGSSGIEIENSGNLYATQDLRSIVSVEESRITIDYGHKLSVAEVAKLTKLPSLESVVPEVYSFMQPTFPNLGAMETIDYGHGQPQVIDYEHGQKTGNIARNPEFVMADRARGRLSPLATTIDREFQDRPQGQYPERDFEHNRISTDRGEISRNWDSDKQREREKDRSRDRDRDKISGRGGRDFDRDYHKRDDSRERSSYNRDYRARDPHPMFPINPSYRGGASSSKPIDTKSEMVLIEDLLGTEARRSRPPRIVIILRGSPGSGKTFVAKLIKDKEVENGGSAPRMLCLDDYFMLESEKVKKDPETGKNVKIKSLEYEYEPEMEESYRGSLLKTFKKTVEDGFFPFIIVDAINERIKYFEEMWSFAKQKGFQVYIAEMDMDSSTCHKRNIHGRSLDEIKNMILKWETTPRHYLKVDVRSLLQDAAITEVQMEDSIEEITVISKGDPDIEIVAIHPAVRKEEVAAVALSKWEKMEATEERLDKLDGLRSVKRKRDVPQSLEDYLQLPDDYAQRKSQPGKKRVRWADIEEGKDMERRRAVGFVVGQTDWKKLTDPMHAQRALTRTKYI